ncbi:hypothetical protein BDZ89DRAFT_1045864 [Hymenopellis radicata]|nr:hypothetical protein BDZ89DRAFT_1045864 [Hymenopellis radicata]
MNFSLPLYHQPSPYAAYLTASVAVRERGLFDVLELQAFVEAAIKDVHALEACLAKHRVKPNIPSGALTAIQLECTMAQDFCDAHMHILTPIHTLPVEIMTRIFDHTFDKPFPMTRGPWFLTRVCRRWREIAVTYPSLWTSFTIVSPTTASAGRPTYEKPLNLHVLRAILAYSHPLPLSFAPSLGPRKAVVSSSLLSRLQARTHALEQCAVHPLDELFIFPDYARELVKLALGWKSVTLSDYAFWLPYIGDTPILEHLCLAQTRRRGWFDLDRLKHFRGASRLRSLVLAGPSLGSFPTSPDAVIARSGGFPWTQLTHLTLVLDDTWMTYLILQLCPNLVSFRDLTRKDVWHTTLQYPVIRHGKLQSLHSFNRGVLNRLQCPNIRHLSSTVRHDLLPAIKSFVERSTAFRVTKVPLHITLAVAHDFYTAEMTRYLLDDLSTHVINQLTFVVPAHRPFHLLNPILIYMARSLAGLFPTSRASVFSSHTTTARAPGILMRVSYNPRRRLLWQ